MAHGRRSFTVNGLDQLGAWLELTVTLTNGSSYVIGRTNTTPLNNRAFLEAFAAQINATPELQGGDGVTAEDVADEAFGAISFALRARSPGSPASTVETSLQVSPGGSLSPSGPGLLQDNLSDLRSRNHLYTSTGLASVSAECSLDTLPLPDGHHLLTAVAYEGTSVFSQTHASVSVVIANTSLQAVLALAEPGSTFPANSSVQFVVTANTNTVNEILLLTTGGLYAGVTNQPAASFVVQAEDLGVGDHSFYALLSTVNGLRYRTAPVHITITR
jgi:hypothetical protein